MSVDIKIRNGFNLNLNGEANKILSESERSNTYALKPTDFFCLKPKLLVNEGDKVENNQILAEWDPYTLPIIAERNGFVKYADLKQGISFRELIDDTTGISSKIVIDWSQNQKSKNFKPAINIASELSDLKDDDLNICLLYTSPSPRD